MTHLETTQTDMLRRVKNFGTAHVGDFPAGSVGAKKFSEVSAAVPDVDEKGANQVSGANTAKGGTKLEVRLHALLHTDLAAINKNAHTLADLGTPDLDAKFRMPRSAGHQAILNAARAFAKDALPLKAQFISLSMPADFLDTLNAHITAFEGARTTQSDGQRQRGGATGGIEDTVHTSLVAARVLDTIVRNTYRNNPAVLAEWTIASHVEHAPQHAQPQPPPPVTKPAA